MLFFKLYVTYKPLCTKSNAYTLYIILKIAQYIKLFFVENLKNDKNCYQNLFLFY